MSETDSKNPNPSHVEFLSYINNLGFEKYEFPTDPPRKNNNTWIQAKFDHWRENMCYYLGNKKCKDKPILFPFIPDVTIDSYTSLSQSFLGIMSIFVTIVAYGVGTIQPDSIFLIPSVSAAIIHICVLTFSYWHCTWLNRKAMNEIILKLNSRFPVAGVIPYSNFKSTASAFKLNDVQTKNLWEEISKSDETKYLTNPANYYSELLDLNNCVEILEMCAQNIPIKFVMAPWFSKFAKFSDLEHHRISVYVLYFFVLICCYIWTGCSTQEVQLIACPIHVAVELSMIFYVMWHDFNLTNTYLSDIINQYVEMVTFFQLQQRLENSDIFPNCSRNCLLYEEYGKFRIHRFRNFVQNALYDLFDCTTVESNN